ncbi:MAG: citrate (Si)-synthase [Myxococcales bacterium]|nr:citrate (Si)-synthase [Myxococcales bacterium]|tara:strand:+ start:301 stop:1584 length:1284 start_codon:yes stop_codon:yes gene_type:complete
MSENATLNVADKEYSLAMIRGTEGETAVDIRKLRGQSGLVTLDDGYGNTGACQSSVTFLNGEEGILRYRGYPIEQLADQSTFLEVCYLLINGELPNQDELDDFVSEINHHSLIHEHMRGFFDAFPPDAHPMAILSSVVSGLSTFYQDSPGVTDPEARKLNIIRLLAKLPTIAAFSYRKSHGLPLMYPDNTMPYSANFLQMMFSYPTEPYEVDPELARAMDVLLILHADHEQNCSTSTVRLVGSSKANLFASIAAGICALWGPLHGGANQKVLEMLAEIKEDGGDVKRAVLRAKDKDDPFRLMGFGHRVYKNYDPRATIIKGHCDKILDKLGIDDPLLDIARGLEEAALSDDYFIERKLYPNVDFYSGIIYRAMGFPVNMFTVLFALGRLPGWIAQWKEMLEDNSRIGRPRQIYTGANERDYKEMGAR